MARPKKSKKAQRTATKNRSKESRLEVLRKRLAAKQSEAKILEEEVSIREQISELDQKRKNLRAKKKA